ncbi:helix-turn-helix domain-containing protein [Vibrio sp. LaRot3]|uniref:helix-turn-helix domain-containing protein n=1 Tax=Vibrio sp. LaRot3 TaxID=2998829 RepID=UPI0022CDC45F|nr:AraC family transcriptional regulator [Vibrio sp. LaRot3]MDA0149591.1 AraC family transcriptional regulator [Vibrio sp. LaRot3]
MGVGTKSRPRLEKVALTKKIEESEKQLIVGVSRRNNGPLVEGHFVSHRVDDCFTLHGSRSEELTDSNIVSTAPVSIIVTLLLQGHLEFGYDDLEFNLDARIKAEGILVNLTKPANFRRRITKGNHVTKLNLMLKPDWILARSSETCRVRQFLKGHKNSIRFDLTPEIYQLVDQVLDLHNATSFLNKIKLEKISMQLMEIIFAQLEQQAIAKSDTKFEPIAQADVEDIISYIETNLDNPLTIDLIAHRFAMSPSNIQRKFRNHIGCTINGYIRTRRLEIAKQHLERGIISITEAAYEAGYTHPSNFTIAFKKAFGYPPNAMMRKDMS